MSCCFKTLWSFSSLLVFGKISKSTVRVENSFKFEMSPGSKEKTELFLLTLHRSSQMPWLTCGRETKCNHKINGLKTTNGGCRKEVCFSGAFYSSSKGRLCPKPTCWSQSQAATGWDKPRKRL